MRTTNTDRPLGEMFGGLLSGTADAMERHRTAPPRTQAITRGKLGTGLLVLAVYGVIFARDATGRSAGELITTLMRAPSNSDAWMPLAIEAGCILLGVVWLMSGLRGSAAFPRDGMKAFWSGVRLALFGGGLWFTTYGDPTWRGGLSEVQLGVLVFAIPELVGFLLNVRSGGRAEKLIARQIEDAEIPWRPAGRG